MEAMTGSPPLLILASASSRRLDLLKLAGVTPIVVAAEIDEEARPGESAAQLVERLARTKAMHVAENCRPTGVPTFVLGGDTEVLVDGQVLGKPEDDASVVRMLQLLSGRSHEVVSGVAVVELGGELRSAVGVTTVWMRELTADDISWYLASGEPFGKAGAYAIQGLGSLFVDRIEGNHAGVVGLPVPLVETMLTGFGYPLRCFMTGVA